MSLKALKIFTGCLLTTGLLSLGNLAHAQQVTYFDFDAPFQTDGFSYSCESPTAPILCFNDGTGSNSNPSFFSDTYPANIDPDNNAMHTAVQMTPSVGGQAGSMWFSLPQKISSGFTTYFAFKITPDLIHSTPADGIAFVIQNSSGGGSAGICAESGSGLTAVGGAGGCIGYGGIDNSVAFELDTYTNDWDANNNHVAVQSCGAGAANSPDHSSCLANFSTGSAINNAPGLTLADGNVHEVVIEYGGSTGNNQLSIYIDPPFNSGTHTPTALAVPVITGTYDISSNVNFMTGGSAYVGFTSGTGAAFEQHEVLAWTFTPHTTSSQTQPLNVPGTTTFPFGTHTFGITYPPDAPSNGTIDTIVTANTITPAFFTALSAGRPYAGSQCQVYDDTGGNCIVYSVECVTHNTTTVVPCPPTSTNPISLKSAYNNSVQPISPGFLQGDPLYTLLTSVIGNGTTATVLCTSECVVTAGQIVTLANIVDGSNNPIFNGNVTVLAADPNHPNTFTISSAVSGTGTGGFVASNNVQNIFASYVPQRIDGTTTGRVKNFSDFVVTSATAQKVASSITITTDTPNPSQATLPVSLAFTVSSITGPPAGPTGNYSLTSSVAGDNVTSCHGTLVAGAGSCSVTFSTPGNRTLTVHYAGDANFIASTIGVLQSVNGGAIALVSPTSINFGNVKVKTIAVKTVTITNVGTLPLLITDKFLQIVGGGNSNSFGAATLCPKSLAPGKSCAIIVAFVANSIFTPQTATLVITDNAISNPQMVPLLATVVKK